MADTDILKDMQRNYKHPGQRIWALLLVDLHEGRENGCKVNTDRFTGYKGDLFDFVPIIAAKSREQEQTWKMTLASTAWKPKKTWWRLYRSKVIVEGTKIEADWWISKYDSWTIGKKSVFTKWLKNYNKEYD